MEQSASPSGNPEEPVAPIHPAYVQAHLRASIGVVISLEQAAQLVPLVRAQRGALARLERFDVGGVRLAGTFDLRRAYRESRGSGGDAG